jgi:hypothetical protein
MQSPLRRGDTVRYLSAAGGPAGAVWVEACVERVHSDGTISLNRPDGTELRNRVDPSKVHHTGTEGDQLLRQRSLQLRRQADVERQRRQDVERRLQDEQRLQDATKAQLEAALARISALEAARRGGGGGGGAGRAGVRGGRGGTGAGAAAGRRAASPGARAASPGARAASPGARAAFASPGAVGRRGGRGAAPASGLRPPPPAPRGGRAMPVDHDGIEVEIGVPYDLLPTAHLRYSPRDQMWNTTGFTLTCIHRDGSLELNWRDRHGTF